MWHVTRLKRACPASQHTCMHAHPCAPSVCVRVCAAEERRVSEALRQQLAALATSAARGAQALSRLAQASRVQRAPAHSFTGWRLCAHQRYRMPTVHGSHTPPCALHGGRSDAKCLPSLFSSTCLGSSLCGCLRVVHAGGGAAESAARRKRLLSLLRWRRWQCSRRRRGGSRPARAGGVWRRAAAAAGRVHGAGEHARGRRGGAGSGGCAAWRERRARQLGAAAGRG